jgi:hypothetical protein
MPGAPATIPDYRIAAGKDVYRIEKNTGGKWASIAVFAVSAASCKSPEQKQTAPTPETPPDNAGPKEPQ